VDTLQEIPESVSTSSDHRPERVRKRARRRFEIQIVGALLIALATGSYDIHTMRGTTFYSDEWPGLARYSWSPHVLLQPQAGHLFYFSTILWQSIQAIFGAKSYLPFLLLGLGCNLFVAAAVLTYGWKRLGYGAGLLLELIVLTMGSSFQTVLWPAAALGILSIGALVFCLLLLDQPSRWGDALIVIMLIAMIGAGGYGLIALFGVIVEILLRRQWRRLWIPAIPTVLYLAWRADFHASLTTAGASGVGPVPFTNLTGATSYIAQQLAATVAGLTGQVTTMGAALTVGLVVVIVWLSRNGHADKVRIAVLGLTPVFFWSLLAVVRGQDNEFGAPRYVAFGAIPIALLVLEAVRSQPRSRSFKYAAVAAVGFCVLANFNQLEIAGGDFRYLGTLDLPVQTALQMAAEYVPPSLVPYPSTASELGTGPYLRVVRIFGSNAPTPAQLVTEPEVGRATADQVLIEAGAIRFVTRSSGSHCGAANTNEVVPVAAGRSFTLRVLTSNVAIFARRFADQNQSQH
jgi:hypothetical protein